MGETGNRAQELFTADQLMAPGDEAGVSLGRIGRAITTWRAMRSGPCSVGHVAHAFNTTPEIVRDAVEEAYWCFLEGTDDTPLAEMLVETDGE